MCKNLSVKFDWVTPVLAGPWSLINMRITIIVWTLLGCLVMVGAGKSVSPPLISRWRVAGLPGRAKRDLTCAVKGHTSCSLSCRLRGLAGGECGWNTTSAAYDCLCEEERRGVRCNVGGQTVCHASCLAIGHTGGHCDDQFNCQCSGRRIDWGLIISNIK